MAAIISLAFFDSPIWNNIVYILGELLVIMLAVWVLISIILGVLIVLSIRRKRMYFPRLLRPFLTAMEGTVRVVCMVLGVDSAQLMEFLIKIDNQMNFGDFARVPVGKRAVFFPQCLRSGSCPAHLTPDGMQCVSCGRCGLGEAVRVLRGAGYLVFIVPGSTFIKRMVKKYHPEAMIGVGCLVEVKDGLELGRKISMITIGVVTKTDGCVETTMDFEDLMDAASIGLPAPLHMPEKDHRA